MIAGADAARARRVERVEQRLRAYPSVQRVVARAASAARTTFAVVAMADVSPRSASISTGFASAASGGGRIRDKPSTGGAILDRQ